MLNLFNLPQENGEKIQVKALNIAHNKANEIKNDLHFS